MDERVTEFYEKRTQQRLRKYVSSHPCQYCSSNNDNNCTTNCKKYREWFAWYWRALRFQALPAGKVWQQYDDEEMRKADEKI